MYTLIVLHILSSTFKENIMSDKVMVNFRFSAALREQLKKMARDNGVSVAEFVRTLVVREMLK